MSIIHHFLANRTTLPIYLRLVSWTVKYHVFFKDSSVWHKRKEMSFNLHLDCYALDESR